MDSRPVKIYCSRDLSRLKYIAGLILGEVLGLSWDVVTDKRKLGKSPVINYSDEDLPGSFRIKPAPLLYESGVRYHEIITKKWNGLPVFFCDQTESDLPFDIFAASFFLVTRYEEYLNSAPDKSGQFLASSSVAFKNGFLEIPVVDLWAREFSKTLVKKFQTLTFKGNEYKALMIIDADKTASRAKSLFNTVGELLKNKGLLKSLPSGSNDNDLSDGFRFIFENTGARSVKFFFPVGDHSSEDNIPSWKNTGYRRLIKSVAGKYDTGLKTSFKAKSDFKVIKKEITRLTTIISGKVFSSLFNSHRLSIPGSYRHAQFAGITEDYSMGYSEVPGFRAGISRPFYFYDVLDDNATALRVFPYQIMDMALYCERINRTEPMDVMLKLINETRNAGGLFISIWHNSSLNDCEEMQNRRKDFKSTLEHQVQ